MCISRDALCNLENRNTEFFDYFLEKYRQSFKKICMYREARMLSQKKYYFTEEKNNGYFKTDSNYFESDEHHR